MGFKKTLATLITASAITVGTTGLALISGCETSCKLEEKTVSLDSPDFESEAYDFLNSFSDKIPDEFLLETTPNGSFYHDKSLILKEDKINIESGKGRFVFRINSEEKTTKTKLHINPKNIAVGYTDVNETNELLATKDIRLAKSNILFRAYPNVSTESYGAIDDFFIIMKGNKAAFYVKENSSWKKGIIKIKNVGEMTNVDYKKLCKEPVLIQDVRKYTELTEKFNKTYSEEHKSFSR